ncbi:MAG TPA: hypothetical protein VF159_01305 [Gemmatimonadaceae bacterium]
MRASTWKVLVTTCAAVALTACGWESPTRPSRTVDLNVVISQMTAPDDSLPDMGVPAAPGFQLAPSVGAAATLVPRACTYSASLSGFACPPRGVNGLTITGSFYLYDDAGRALGLLDPIKTASVRTVTDAQGAERLSSFNLAGTGTVTQHSDMTMTGLHAATLTLNGTTAVRHDVTLTSPDSMHLVVDVTTTRKDLVLPAPGSTDRYPKSGSITIDGTTRWSVVGKAPDSVAARAVFRFDGTSIVVGTLTSGASTTVCTYDRTGILETRCHWSGASTP